MKSQILKTIKFKQMISKFISGGLLLILYVNSLYAIAIQVPTPSGQEDIIITGPSKITSDEGTIFDIIQIINDYLWFLVAGVAMIVIVVAGMKLILAGGDKEKMAASNRLLLSAMIAIFVAILSYAIIKLVINLF